MRVGRVRSRARIQRGDVHLELVEGASRELHDLAALADFGLVRLETRPQPRRGVERAGGLLRDRRAGNGDGRCHEGNDGIATRDHGTPF
jgi:hypothetical protein